MTVLNGYSPYYPFIISIFSRASISACRDASMAEEKHGDYTRDYLVTRRAHRTTPPPSALHENIRMERPAK